MEMSEDITKLAPELLNVQDELGAVTKDAKNPFFNSNYADLTSVINAVKEPLNKHGIVFLQGVGMDAEGRSYIETVLLHRSGQYIKTKTLVYCKKENDPQAFGSGITYSKRYALQAILGLPTEDDDANAASGKSGPAPLLNIPGQSQTVVNQTSQQNTTRPVIPGMN